MIPDHCTLVLSHQSVRFLAPSWTLHYHNSWLLHPSANQHDIKFPAPYRAQPSIKNSSAPLPSHASSPISHIQTTHTNIHNMPRPYVHTEPLFVNLLRSSEIDSQPGWPLRQPYLSYRPARVHMLAESIPRNPFLGSINVYKYRLRHLRLAMHRQPTSIQALFACRCIFAFEDDTESLINILQFVTVLKLHLHHMHTDGRRHLLPQWVHTDVWNRRVKVLL